jgi:hypothetical protein
LAGHYSMKWEKPIWHGEKIHRSETEDNLQPSVYLKIKNRALRPGLNILIWTDKARNS